jgi:hypothetical protein
LRWITTFGVVHEAGTAIADGVLQWFIVIDHRQFFVARGHTRSLASPRYPSVTGPI